MSDTFFFIINYASSYRWVSAFFGVVAFVLFLPLIFTEFDVAKIEREQNSEAAANAQKLAQMLPPPDRLVMFVCIATFFIYMLNFVLIEA